ncbi:MAM and LDL-receptor class A domain-containing protein 1 [Chionoecetes opilio]|uniref:MAM and LDL-receptor class A domain-containing protein 1 n=1 Tax=Chionoecetes opilio TaxID=41210 RepID=A0A8J5CM90_CHIOP|nr:MAM and LDL-receptor class A domain-containing protein 1 [Chionoecetes opilio]
MWPQVMAHRHYGNKMPTLLIGNKNKIKIGDKRNFILYLEGVHGDGKSYIALDDFDFHDCESSGECHSTLDFRCADGSCVAYQRACDAQYDCEDKSDEYHCDKLQGDCSFDAGDWAAQCGWVQSQEDDKEWAAASGSPNPALGPPHDHALAARGHYLYMDSQDEHPGRTATVSMGALYPASEGICYVRFWYYIHNDNITADTGTLRLVREVNDGHRYPLLIRSGNYMDKWLQEVVVVSSGSPFYLLFEGETGDPFQTYIALDDVSVTPSCVSGVLPPSSNTTWCEPGQRACVGGECVAADFFCDCFVDCQDGSDERNCSLGWEAARPDSSVTTCSGRPEVALLPAHAKPPSPRVKMASVTVA